MADFVHANGTILRKEMHFFYGNPASTDPPPSDPTKFAPWWEGLEYQTYIADGNYQVRQAVQQDYRQRPCTEGNCWFGDPGDESAPSHDPRVCRTATTLDNVTSGVLYQYDDRNNLTDKWEYDYGAAPGIGTGCGSAPGNYLRHTQTSYVGGDYLAPEINLLSLPDVVTVDVGGTIAAQTHYGYDELPLAEAAGIVGHDGAYGTGKIKRGNLTNPATCLNAPNCTWVNHPRYYDIAGNVVAAYDGNNHGTQFGYNDDGQNKYAFATSVTNALGHKTSFFYDYGAGKPSWMVDANGVGSQFTYDDPLDRLKQVKRAAGGGAGVESQTNIIYPDSTWTVQYQDRNATGDQQYETQTVYDGLGRVVETRTLEDGTYYLAVDTAYDALGRVSWTTNPYRTNYQAETSDGLGFATATTYDVLGRAVRVDTVDGSHTTTDYTGNQATVTDAQGKQRRYTYDAAGRLTSVAEDPAGVNWLTSYTYDALDHLTTVTQGSQTRVFTYDSLGRLRKTTEPETGVITYEYDGNGNLVSRRDNRSVQTV